MPGPGAVAYAEPFFVTSSGNPWPPIWTTAVKGTGSGGEVTVTDAFGLGGVLKTNNTGSYQGASGAVLNKRPLLDVDVVAKFAVPNPLEEQQWGIFLRTREPWYTAYFYPYNGVGIEAYETGGSFDAYELLDGTGGAIGGGSTAFSFTAGTATWLRARAVGNQFMWRGWLDGNVEPTTWNYTYTITDNRSMRPGSVYLYNQCGNDATSRTAWVSKLTVTDLTGPARVR